MRASLFLSAFLLAAAPSWALGFLTHDLGAAGSGEECMQRARQTLDAYSARYGQPSTEVVASQWTASAFSVLPGNADMQIACPYRNFQVEVALLIIHSQGPVSERETILNRVLEIWAATPGRPALSK
jgi:hypothetical protein